MITLHQTESGYMARPTSGRQLLLHFNNLSIRITPRSLRRMRDYLRSMDMSEGMFNPEEKQFSVAFGSYPLTLHFDYFELQEVLELVEEGLAQYELAEMLEQAGVSWAGDSDASC